MPNELDIVGIREAEVRDRAFVMDSWLRSFRLSHFAGPIAMKRYRDVYSEEIADLVMRPKCSVTVAYNSDAPDQLFGFLCFEDGYRYPLIHYIYIKAAFRRRGVGTLLTKDAGIKLNRRFLYTYRTALAHDLTRRGAEFERGKYSPLSARFSPKD